MKSVLSGFLGLLLCASFGCGGGAQKTPLAVEPPTTTTIQVSVLSPGASASVDTNFSVSAQASGSDINGWEIDVDGASAYTAGAVSSIDANLTASAGNHTLLVKAWDAKGNSGKQTVQVSVKAPPPPTIVVTIASPLPSASVDTTFSLSASATGATIAGWEVDVDGSKMYTGGASATMNASLTTSEGSHHLLVKAWDSDNNTGSKTVDISAAAPPKNPLPTPPSSAVVFSDIQAMTTNWGSCGSSSCAGGSGSGSYWQAFNQTSPSLSGSSMEMYRDGVYANSLWWRHLGAQNQATNMLWDFYMKLDDASTTSVQALEYDLYQFLDGYNYMVGSQCEYPAQVWETWDEANGKWMKTPIACKKFSTDKWHHIQWYVTLNHEAHTYTYVTLVVDGTAYSVNQTFGAKHNGWHNNIGVQWQLDVNKTGNGYHEWVDNAKFTVW